MIEIYQLAKKAGACSPGLQELENAKSVHEQIRLLKSGKGIEFVMGSNFLTESIYNQYRSELEKENIFISGCQSIVNPRLVIVLGGKVNIEVDGFQVCEIYAKGTAVINLAAHDNAYVSIELYGSAKLTKELYGQAKIKEYLK